MSVHVPQSLQSTAIRMLRAFAAALIGVAATTATVASPARTVVVPACSWDRPGHDPFTGDVVAAVDRYADIDPATRDKLKARMAKRQYDDLVVIRRDSIGGRHEYEPTIRDMHFAFDRVCRSVTRSAWPAAAQERGLVYCEGRDCILVPTVCRNVSRIVRPASPAPTASAPIDPHSGSSATSTPAATSMTDAAPAAPAMSSQTAGADTIPMAHAAAPPVTFIEAAGTPISWSAVAPAAVGGASTLESASREPTFVDGLRWPISSAPVGASSGVLHQITAPSRAGSSTTAAAWSRETLPTLRTMTFDPSVLTSSTMVTPLAPVPEPQTWAMMALGLLAMVIRARRRVQPAARVDSGTRSAP